MSAETKIEDGGPAFPFTEPPADVDAHECGRVHRGMKLRDYFAAQALSGLLSKGTEGTFSRQQGVVKAATWAYEYADAMLRARTRND